MAVVTSFRTEAGAICSDSWYAQSVSPVERSRMAHVKVLPSMPGSRRKREKAVAVCASIWAQSEKKATRKKHNLRRSIAVIFDGNSYLCERI